MRDGGRVLKVSDDAIVKFTRIVGGLYPRRQGRVTEIVLPPDQRVNGERGRIHTPMLRGATW